MAAHLTISVFFFFFFLFVSICCYFPGQQPPTAVLEASKTDGALSGGEFKVQFDAGASTDPDGDPLHYEWDLDGDGKFDDGSDSEAVEHTYTTATNVTVKVRVSDPYGFDDVAQVPLYPGDLGPPVPQILTPIENLNWAIGDQIHYEGSATDPDGATLGNGLVLHWVFNVRHCPNVVDCHTHYEIGQSDSASGTFVAPPHEYPSHLLLELTATDKRGRSVTVSRDVYPKVIQIGIASEPAGAPLTIEGLPPEAGPLSLIAGGSTTVTASESTVIGGQSYSFESWSDGGAPTHEVTSKDSMTLVARYRPTALAPEAKLPFQAEIAGIRVSSRPRGAKLWIGDKSRRGSLSAQFVAGSRATIKAAPGFRKGRRSYVFKGWLADGHSIGRAKTKSIVAGQATSYIALYKRRR